MRDDILACTTRDQFDEALVTHGIDDITETAQSVGGVDYEIHTIFAPGLTITLHQWPADSDIYGSATQPTPIKVLEVAEAGAE